MQVGNYPTRDFATFEPSELQLPFTIAQKESVNNLYQLNSTGQASDPIHHFSILQSPVFLINSRSPLFRNHTCCQVPLFSQSYEVILPNSFNIIKSKPQYSLLIYLWRFKYDLKKKPKLFLNFIQKLQQPHCWIQCEMSP